MHLAKLRSDKLEEVYTDQIEKCHFLKPCKACKALEKICLDHSQDLKNRFIIDGSYFSYQTLTDSEIIFDHQNSVIYTDRPDYLTSYMILDSRSKLLPDLIYFSNCHFETKIVKEYLYQLKNVDSIKIAFLIYNLYYSTRNNYFLHGEPHLDFIGKNKKNEPRIITSPMSTFYYKDKKIVRRNVTKPIIKVTPLSDRFQIETNLSYDLLSQEWYPFLWVMEYYCWMISLYLHDSDPSEKWLKYFNSLFEEDQISELKKCNNNFIEIFSTVKKLKLLKKIPRPN